MPKAKKRDPNKPKRALTGFMFYSKQRRAEVQRESPELKFVDVGRQLGDEWKRMSKAAKQPYEDLAIKDKERYKDAMEDYTPDEKFQRKGTRRDPNKPKRAMSAYLYFCEAHRESVKSEFPEKKMIEVQKVLGDRWKDTPEHQRRPYILQADADRERYDAAMLRAAKSKAASLGRGTADAADDEAAGEEDEGEEEEEEEEGEGEEEDIDDDDGDDDGDE